MIIGDPLTSLFTPSQGKHQSGLAPAIVDVEGKYFFIKYFLSDKYFLFHLTQTEHVSRLL